MWSLYYARCGTWAKVGISQNPVRRMRELSKERHQPVVLAWSVLAGWTQPAAVGIETEALSCVRSIARDFDNEWFMHSDALETSVKTAVDKPIGRGSYYRPTCDICDRPSFVRIGARAYCRAHKAIAEEGRKAWGRILEVHQVMAWEQVGRPVEDSLNSRFRKNQSGRMKY